MPLTYRDRGTSGTQLDVVAGSLVVGSIRKVPMSLRLGGGRTEQWEWTLFISAARMASPPA